MKTSVIYTPRGAAREYAMYACNVYRGCSHGCSYCFGPATNRTSKVQFLQPATRGPDFLERVDTDAKRMSQDGKVSFQVHLCFTTDPYQPLDEKLHITRDVIQILHNHGLWVAILTKGGKRALRDIDLFGPHDAMAATMTYGTNMDTLREEPGSAMPQDRWDALKEFHDAKVPTWISCEPVMDPKHTLYLISKMHRVVDHVKVGKLNHDPEREKKIDWLKFGGDAITLLESLGYKRIHNPDDAIRSNADHRTYYIKSGLAQILEG